MIRLRSKCVLWEGSVKPNGYPSHNEHRRAWKQAHGPIPRGLEVHHKCEVKICLNTSHMRLVTRAEHNALHGQHHLAAAKRRAITHCVHGHEFTTANTGWNPHRPPRAPQRYCRTCRNERRRKHGSQGHVR